VHTSRQVLATELFQRLTPTHCGDALIRPKLMFVG
jgi:hypothetical protein